ncbi:hypothetical protein [Streptomyces sp. NPDC054838]
MTDIKNPNAQQVSRILNSHGFTKANRTTNGYKVTRETGQRIDFNLNQSIGARFPVVQVTLPADDAERAIEVLAAAGYHAEAANIPARRGVTATSGAVTKAAVLVISPEELADRAARKERAANADALADEMVPSTSRVRVRLTTFPDWARRELTLARADVVAKIANLLRNPRTDVLDDDAIMRDLEYRRQEGVTGLYVRDSKQRGNLLLFPIPGDADGAPAAVEPAPVTTAPVPAATPEKVVEGTLVPAGQALGTAPQHSNNPDAVAAVAVLTAAGHTPALVSGEYDDDDNDTARGTGFMIDPRGNGRMNIHHLVEGASCTPERDTWPAVKQYRRLFSDLDGWSAPRMPGRTAMVVRMYAEDSPTTAQVRAASLPTVEEIVDTVKIHAKRAEIVERAEDGLDIGRFVAYHAYGMSQQQMDETDWDSVRAALLDLPSLEGHQVTVTADDRPTGKVTVRLWQKGHGVPAYSVETWNRSADAYRSIASGMIRARQAALAERAALDSLDDATLYEVTTTRGGIPQGAPQRLDGAAVRALLQHDRDQSGEERPNAGPYLEITRNGAMWRTVHVVFNEQGHRSPSKSWTRRVVPAVVADAGQIIMGAGYSLLSPVETLNTRAFGPWVRPVPGHADRVIVSRVANGEHRRPDGGTFPEAAARWDEETDDYASILRGHGWTEVQVTDEGVIFSKRPL